jgi:uncharacterized protein
MNMENLFGITLGVADIDSAIAFYQRLGWPRPQITHSGHMAQFALGVCNVTIIPRDILIEEAGLLGLSDMGSICHCMNMTFQVNSLADVSSYLQKAKSAGGTILKAAVPRAEGGCSGYFMDPDGHIFEIAYNPVLPKP